MADPDSCSMTPPMSPLMGLADGDFPALAPSPPKARKIDYGSDSATIFDCLGEVSSSQEVPTHSKSYLQQGKLDRLLRESTSEISGDVALTTELFGHQFVTLLALDESMDTLFYLCRQTIDSVTSAQAGTSDASVGPLGRRQNLRIFFDYIKAFILRLPPGTDQSSDSLVRRLLVHLRSLILHLGTIHQLPNHIITTCASRYGNQSTLASYHTFHLRLDVRWSIIEVVHLLSVRFPGSCDLDLIEVKDPDPVDLDLFSQLVQLTLTEHVAVAVTTHAKLSLSSYRQQSPFPCSCVKELLIMLLKLLQHRHKKLAKQSFWVSLHPLIESDLLQERYSEASSEPVEVNCNKLTLAIGQEVGNPVGFWWWMLLHLYPLFLYDDFGVPGRTISLMESGQHNYFSMQTLLKSTLSDKVTEGQMRGYLRCCLQLSKAWGPNTDVVILIWEHFYKKLNGHFRQSGVGVEGLASMCKTPSSLLEQCRLRCTGDTPRPDENSFHIFLHILSVHLTASSPGGRMNTIWSKVKGRFYTKFHPRRMQELTEVGLTNFTSLFLTLAMTTNMEDVLTRMCDLYGTLGATRREPTWRGLFAAVTLLTETAKDVSFITDKLVEDFNSISSDFGASNLDVSSRSDLFPLITFYLEATQDLIEGSASLGLGVHRLIGAGLKDILKVCRENELRVVLSFCQAVLSKVRQLENRRNGADGTTHTSYMADRMWTSVLEFVKSHACTQTPPPHVADVAASFTLLSMNSPPSIRTTMKDNFLSLFQYFGWNSQVNTSVSCRFLCHLLANPSVLERLSLQLDNHQQKLVSAWFRCSWQLPHSDKQMSELSRLVLRLSSIRNILDTVEDSSEVDANDIHRFIQALGIKYSQLNDLREKGQFQTWVQQLLGDVSRPLLAAQRPGAPTDHLTNAYLLGGLLAKHCAKVLYVKFRTDCILPLLLERLAMPRLLFNTTKTVPPSLLSAIRDHLHLGTSRLDFHHDPYVQRKIREMVTQYLPRFPIRVALSTSASAVHPLVGALSESFTRHPPEEAIQFRQHIFGVVVAEFIKPRTGSPPAQVSLGLGYISEVISKTHDHAVICRDCSVLLGPVMEQNLQNDTQAGELLRTLLAACSKSSSESVNAELSKVLEEFITQHLASHQMKVLRLMESVSGQCPAVLSTIIPAMTTVIRAVEKKRGVGLDKQLRLAYFAVLNNLGPAGEAEKSALLANDI